MNPPKLILLASLLALPAPAPLRAATWDGGLSHGFTLNDLSPRTDVAFGFSTVRTTATQNLATPFFLSPLPNLSNSNVTVITGNALSFSNNGTLSQNSVVPFTISSQIVLNGPLMATGDGLAPLSLASPISGPGSVRYAGAAGGTP